MLYFDAELLTKLTIVDGAFLSFDSHLITAIGTLGALVYTWIY
jgi:hypothetical protein